MSQLTKHFSTKTVCLWPCGEILLELVDTLSVGGEGRGERERRKGKGGEGKRNISKCWMS